MRSEAQREATQQIVELSVELEAKLLERLIYEWRAINYTYFKGALRQPVLRLSETTARLGQWHGELRSLEVSRPLVLERPWAEVMEVLKHEVAHQFVDERLAVDEPAHGPTFRRICERLGIDARAVGSPVPAQPGEEPQEDSASRTVARIRKLLALAQSPNQNEAEAAATHARRLMLKFNIEVDQIGADQKTEGQRRYGYRHLGRPSGRILEHDRRLARILVTYFFVEGIWLPVYRPLDGKRGSVFEICGLEPNLLMAEHVHAFLTSTAQRLWSEFKRDSKRTSNSDRQAFLAGVMKGFDTKLAAQTADFQEQGLVWVPAPDLHDYFRTRYPKIQTVARGGARRNAAYNEGNRAGREIVLSQPVESGSSNARPKALRSGR